MENVKTSGKWIQKSELFAMRRTQIQGFDIFTGSLGLSDQHHTRVVWMLVEKSGH